MNMKNFNVFCLLLLTLPSVLFGKNNPEKRRPNIVFIMSDDHAYQAISAYSDKLIKTPNIDRIAKNGIKFTQACVTNSICAPSRATSFGNLDLLFGFIIKATIFNAFPALVETAKQNHSC